MSKYALSSIYNATITVIAIPTLTLLTALMATPATNSALAAEACATAPTCAELGYILTSSTNCAGTPLKCPFDKTKFYCTTKQEAAAAAMPDYSQALGRSLGVTYTATSNGFIIGYDNQRSEPGFREGADGGIQIRINGKDVRLLSNQVNWATNNWSYPVKKGNTYYVNGQGNGFPLWLVYQFVPSN